MTRYPQIVLFVLAVPILLVGLGWAPLIDWDENIYAEVARQIVLRGELIVLYLNGHIFWEKPPLFLWEMAAFFKMFGVNGAVARMTSAINGLLILAALYVIGKRLWGALFGWIWAMVYLSSLLPLLLSRSAVIDHTFNGLIMLSTFLLIFYDRAHVRYRRGEGPRRDYWGFLFAASLAMGLGVLAKGPLGGAVPLAAFAGYKVWHLRPIPRLGHVLVCGVVSLALALSWYAANYSVLGSQFIDGFVKFQGLLFSKPLEGHGGPFYYHILVAMAGLFPWTPLLLLYLGRERRKRLWGNSALRPLIGCCMLWTAFVLLLFSLVQTKLPHYSSVIYIPLSMLVAFALTDLVRRRQSAPRWLGGLFAGYCSLVGILFAVLPYALERIAAGNGLVLAAPPQPPAFAWLPGILLTAGGLLAGASLVRGAVLRAVAIAVLAMGVFMLGLWRVHLPQFAAYNQGTLVGMMDEAYDSGGDLVLYRIVSFAVLFYGQRDVEMLHTYKFPGDPSRLDSPGPRPIYVVTGKSKRKRLRREHPLLEPVRNEAGLFMFVLAPQSRH